MCGSYTAPSLQEIYEEYALTTPFEFAPPEKTFPQQKAPVIINNGVKQLKLMQWGLIPHWARDPEMGRQTFNARAETTATKPSFRDAFKKRRCLVPARCFYEWQEMAGQKKKTPYSVGLKGRSLFSMAGIWDEWTDRKTGEIIDSFSIVTTEPNDVIQPIHGRMPVILKKDDEMKWLEPHLEGSDLLRPYESGAMWVQDT